MPLTRTLAALPCRVAPVNWMRSSLPAKRLRDVNRSAGGAHIILHNTDVSASHLGNLAESGQGDNRHMALSGYNHIMRCAKRTNAASAGALSLGLLFPIWVLFVWFFFSTAIAYEEWLRFEEAAQGVLRSTSTTLSPGRRCSYAEKWAVESSNLLSLRGWYTSVSYDDLSGKRLSSDSPRPVVVNTIRFSFSSPFHGNLQLISTYFTNPDAFKSRTLWDHGDFDFWVCLAANMNRD